MMIQFESFFFLLWRQLFLSMKVNGVQNNFGSYCLSLYGQNQFAFRVFFRRKVIQIWNNARWINDDSFLDYPLKSTIKLIIQVCTVFHYFWHKHTSFICKWGIECGTKKGHYLPGTINLELKAQQFFYWKMLFTICHPRRDLLSNTDRRLNKYILYNNWNVQSWQSPSLPPHERKRRAKPLLRRPRRA